jgi:membrane-associated phospholipid phosphatase
VICRMTRVSETIPERNDRRLNIIGIALIVLFAILDFVVFSGRLQSSDTASFYSINSAHTLAFDYAMIFLSNYGRELLWGCIIILLWFLGNKESKFTAFILIISFLSLTVLGESLKLLEFRQRPFETLLDVRLLVRPPTDSSFPSGHALMVCAGATVAWHRMKKRYSLPLMLESSLVAYSRIYVGVHYPLDVISGSILGIAIACLILAQSDKVNALYNGILRIRMRFISSSSKSASTSKIQR